jgi:hypothetical protein
MTPTPNGFVGHLFLEEVLRKFLAYQFIQISKNAADPNVTFIDELFARWGDAVRLQIKKWFVEHTNIAVTINYPRQDMPLPSVCVVNSNESEAGQPYLGDYGGEVMIGERSVTASTNETLPPNVYGESLVVTDTRPRGLAVRQLLSVPENRTTQIYIATEDANTTLYLYTVVKALLLVNKIDFDKAGARNLKLSGSDLQFHAELMPATAYMKMLTLNYEMNFDVALSPVSTIKGVNLTLMDFLGNELPTEE